MKRTLYDAQGNRWCSGCQDYVPSAMFARNRRVQDGLQRYCRGCMRYQQARNYHRQPEVRRARTAAWKLAHPDRVRVQNHAANLRRAARRKEV